MNPIVYLRIAGAAIAIALLAYEQYWVYSRGYDSAIAETNKQTEAANLRANEISQKFEQRLSELKIVNTTINKQVTHEVERQVYSDCKLPQSGIDLLNAAVANRLPTQPSP